MAGRELPEKHYTMPSRESKVLAILFAGAWPVSCRIFFFFQEKIVIVLESRFVFVFFSLSMCLFSNLELPIVYL